ncbi:hypothetical protein Tco_0872742 [Tanacetum coccineum]
MVLEEGDNLEEKEMGGSGLVRIGMVLILMCKNVLNIKKDGHKSFQDEERYEHVGPKVTSSQKGERLQDDDEMMFD